MYLLRYNDGIIIDTLGSMQYMILHGTDDETLDGVALGKLEYILLGINISVNDGNICVSYDDIILGTLDGLEIGPMIGSGDGSLDGESLGTMGSNSYSSNQRGIHW